jgi:hypothetical protein
MIADVVHLQLPTAVFMAPHGSTRTGALLQSEPLKHLGTLANR